MQSQIVFSINYITQSNAQEKLDNMEKSIKSILNNESLPETNSIQKSVQPNKNKLILNIKNITKENVRTKLEKAFRTASFTLDVPMKSTGEGFSFKAQEQLTDKWYAALSNIGRRTYDMVIEYFALPKITVMSKSANLTWKGKVLYSPETGEPIKQSDWDHFVKTLDKFMNRNVSDVSKKMILNSKTLGKILDRMLKTNTLEAVKKQSLENLKYKGKTFDWISDSVKNMKTVFGENLTRQEMAKISVIQQSAAEKITKISNDMKSDVKQILIDGVVDKKSKSQVAQSLFDKMIGHNRDFQRIADTELQKTFNNSFIQEEVSSAAPDEKVYFQRIEVVDGNTCDFCKRINGMIAVWSNVPLASDGVKDKYAKVAIWEGKEWDGKKLTRVEDVPCSICHPYCRGTWIRVYPEMDSRIKE